MVNGSKARGQIAPEQTEEAAAKCCWQPVLPSMHCCECKCVKGYTGCPTVLTNFFCSKEPAAGTWARRPSWWPHSVNRKLLRRHVWSLPQLPELPEHLQPAPGQAPEPVPKRRWQPARPGEHFFTAMRKECGKVGLLTMNVRCAQATLPISHCR